MRKFKIKISELPMKDIDKLNLSNMYRQLKEFKVIFKKTTDKDVRDLLQKEISTLKALSDSHAQKFFKVCVQLGPHKEESVKSWYPDTSDLEEMKNVLVQRLSKNRKENKRINKVRRSFNGMGYEMIGQFDEKTDELNEYERPVFTIKDTNTKKPNTDKVLMPGLKGNGRVFEKSGMVLSLYKSDEYVKRIYKAKKPYDKSNYVGVEFELVNKVDRDTLNQLFINAHLSGLVYVKSDSSITVDSKGYFSHEVTIIAKQPNINDVVDRVCKVLNHPDVGSYVNNSCGLHVHLDMRYRKPEHCYENLFRALPIIAGMVPANRTKSDHGKRYCALNTNPDFKQSIGTRYLAINAAAYNSHRTLELRLHSGSTNAKKINNFINILTAIVDKKELVKVNLSQPEELKIIFGIDDYLVKYAAQRINKFTNEALDTKTDHFDQEAV